MREGAETTEVNRVAAPSGVLRCSIRSALRRLGRVTSATPDQTRRPRPPRLSSGWLAILLLGVALVPFVQELTAQPAARYAQTAAITDQGTVRLDDYEAVLNVDLVVRDGHIYGDKAPLQPILAIPVYAAARAVGAEPATELQLEKNLGLWWVTLWSTVVPLLAIAAIGIKLVTRLFGRGHAVQASLTICSGTLLLAYGTQLYAHVLAGLLGWGCWLLANEYLRGSSGSRTQRMWLPLAAGVLGGASVATEYPMAIVVLVVGVVLATRRAWTGIVAFAVGGLPFVGILMAYQAVAFGSPWAVSYSEKPDAGTPGVVVGLPNPLQLLEVLFGSRGLLLFSPIVILAVWGLLRAARSTNSERRRHGLVGLWVFAGFLALQSGWSNAWGGEAPGPRYVIPALPFLIVGMAEIWNVAPRFQWIAIRWSVLAMIMPVVALHLTPSGSYAVVAQLQNLQEYGPVETLWTMLFGPLGVAIHVTTVAVVGWRLVTEIRREAADEASNQGHHSRRPLEASTKARRRATAPS